ncbi:MAG: ribonuclease P protein component [Flammeovirgaceae bacterium]|nr:ribonuclease P protein component [Flammeovirgaceae bacterium]
MADNSGSPDLLFAQTFSKDEKLTSKKAISLLFKEGKSFFKYPYKLIYSVTPAESQLPKVLISIPKKNFKKAVDRNKLKRQTREIYRKNKFLFGQEEEKFIPNHLGFIYVGKEKEDFSVLERSIIKLLKMFISKSKK